MKLAALFPGSASVAAAVTDIGIWLSTDELKVAAAAAAAAFAAAAAESKDVTAEKRCASPSDATSAAPTFKKTEQYRAAWRERSW